jgi:hypothetical protein
LGIYLGICGKSCDSLLSILSCSLNRIRVRADTRAYTLTLKVDISAGYIVNLDYGTSGGGLSASGLTDKTENLSFFYIEGDVISRLKLSFAHLEILTEVLNAKQGFVIIVRHYLLPPVFFILSISSVIILGTSTFGASG